VRRLLILVVGSVLPVLVVAGCIVRVSTYTNSEQTIDTRLNRQFVIGLGSNPTTGYRWELTYDDRMLELVESKYQMGEEAQEGVAGAGGVELFRFKALERGRTEIAMVYRRPWEEPSPQDITKEFTVNIE
jgi:inhibitor of cysteine peptidase